MVTHVHSKSCKQAHGDVEDESENTDSRDDVGKLGETNDVANCKKTANVPVGRSAEVPSHSHENPNQDLPGGMGNAPGR